MLDLIISQMQSANGWDAIWSHSQKPLRIHTYGVLEGVRRRTDLKIPQVATIFHDLGKINPNFKLKLEQKPVEGYSSHAYLSAWSFLRFCQKNSELAQSLGVTDQAALFSIVTMIAHHHGSLPNFREVMNVQERERMVAFLQAEPEMPVSEYLQSWLPHQPFTLWDASSARMVEQCAFVKDKLLDTIVDRLGFFLDTRLGFAAILEADKRDAGNNKWFRRSEQLSEMQGNFAPALQERLASLPSSSALDDVRTEIRKEATSAIERALAAGERVFSLTAPTGAGKTLVLLSLAEVILRYAPDAGVCYALPFLTITEQVETICRGIFGTEIVTRLDSRSNNEKLDCLLAQLEEDPAKSAEVLKFGFSDETFDAALVITTFVQLFETLLTNHGAELMRLPNFAKTIFVIDEIQALPPRLYVFFTALLRAYCERFDCYAILSTATMPAFNLLPKHTDACRLFSNYRTPTKLLNFEAYYKHPVFNRYVIHRMDLGKGSINIAELAVSLRSEIDSCLVILNTVDDTRRLYKTLCPDGARPDVVLLNTHFILDDRQEKVVRCRDRLKQEERIVLISTQLIEAGVDIDFPIVYRDLCPLPSLIQSAGRCNRNGSRHRGGKLIPGDVHFFVLRDEMTDKVRASLVYRDAADGLDFSLSTITGNIAECDLLQVQRRYFDDINLNLEIGRHRLRVQEHWQTDNLVSRILEMSFEIVGSFRLIDEEEYRIERRYYIPVNQWDTAWEHLGSLVREIAQASAQGGNYEEVRVRQAKMFSHLRKMSGRVVQVRYRDATEVPFAIMRDSEVVEYAGICKLLSPDIDYDSNEGLRTRGQGIAIY